MNQMEREQVLELIGREIAPAIAAHTVVLGRIPAEAEEPRVDWLTGTGILTKVESTSSYGILTVGHVVGALRQEHEREDPNEVSLLLRPRREAQGHGRLLPLQVGADEMTARKICKNSVLIFFCRLSVRSDFSNVVAHRSPRPC